MFPFWKDVVAPIIEAAEARRIVEVGALRGENTELMLERLGPDVELHVVDPLPNFDPAEHEARFAGQYVFHCDLSVNVLGDLPPMDVALIDGDHNWYTVFTELTLLATVTQRAGAPLPVMILHDVAWPYGRRDLYYDPTTIPEEHRQPWLRAGIQPGRSQLSPSGAGLNPTLANADVEGGSRNGVMTGVDDFIAGYPRPLRLVVLPIYFGLAIVVEEDRLVRQPGLAAELDRLESPEGKDLLLRLGEEIRLEAAIFDQALLKQRDDRVDHLVDRHLGTVKGAILNDHHIEDEARIYHLMTAIARGAPVNEAVMRDPVRNAAGVVRRLAQRHRTGENLSLDPDAKPEHRVDVGATRTGHTTSGRVGLDHLHECLDDLWARHIRGDLAVCGVGLGGSTVFLAAYLEVCDLEPRLALQRQLWVSDRFRPGPGRRDLNGIRDLLARFDLLGRRLRFLQGEPAATLPDVTADQLALVHVGPGLGGETGLALEQLYPRLTEGGVVVVEDSTDPAVADAVEAYRAHHRLTTPTQRVGRAGMHWIKEEPLGAPSAPLPARRAGASRAPLARRSGFIVPDLSVVVVVHNMRREAPRSLLSLSARYQQGLDDRRFEVIVVENGSDPDQRLGDDLVRSFGRQFRYLDLGDEATPSPAPALNEGIAAAKGATLALMIDGAHVLTPRVLHYGLAGVEAYAPAVVATQPWYVGPGQQGDVMRSGYDQAVEDALFGQICWPEDGYRLFEIGHFVSDRDWFDGLWESNCLFVPRTLLEQVGGFDEAFAMAGGGYTNLDLYERLTSSPDVRVVSIIGEGSFHQVHGGITTNLPDPLERRNRVRSYAEHFAELRGRPFMGPEKPIHYVGGFHAESAKRSRARRMTGAAFEVDGALEGLDGPATPPAVPVADDLRDGFTTAYYRSLAWRQTRWIGHPVRNAPTDLIAYQEIVSEVRPDWIIETGTRDGGRAFFLATVCDLLDHGEVISIDAQPSTNRPAHPRIRYLTAPPHEPDAKERVVELVGPQPSAMVILGSRARRDRTRREFEAFAPLVPVGSYVIMEHTVLNGFPADATFGPDPHEALRRLLNLHGEFLADTERERHGLTFNTGGFLRRIK